VLSVALHVLLLVLVQPGASAAESVALRSAGGPGPISVRLVSADPMRSNGVQVAQPPKPERSVRDPSSSPGSRGQGSRPAAPPAALSIDIPAAADELDSYIPSALLSTPPLASMPIQIEAPPVEAAGVGVLGVFSIYIDDTGVVRHVIAEEPVSLPEVEEAVRKAFIDARFLPGQVGRVLVKSRIRIEVGTGSTG
jgi:hypothetical protein